MVKRIFFKLAGSRQEGFTLIETLMVVFILGLVIVAGGNLFFSIMKGASKAGVVKEVKQNGDYAMAVMERAIRSARSVDACGGGSLTITNQDDSQTSFRCLNSGGVRRIVSGSTVSSSLTGSNVTLGAGGCPATLSFNCTSSVPPSVEITFSLFQSSAGASAESQAQVDFQTTISLRNYE